MTQQQPVEPGAVILRQIGVSDSGAPIYTYRDTSPVPVVPPAAPSRPYGAYIGVGVLGIAGVTALGMVAAILAIALAVSGVALTICVLVLRSVWADMSKGQK